MINKNGITLLIAVMLIISSCNNPNTPSGDITTINVIEALKNEKSLKLSELVKDFEIIELESTRESHFVNLINIQLGEKYIFVWCNVGLQPKSDKVF